jgi:hypothetical protein
LKVDKRSFRKVPSFPSRDCASISVFGNRVTPVFRILARLEGFQWSLWTTAWKW